MNAMNPKAYSYLRFSTPEQIKGDSFRRQSTLATQYCKANGLTLDSELTFHDLGVSAYKGKHAETGRLGDFLQAVDDGIVKEGSFLLVENLDRLSRQTARKALRVLESIVERGVTVVTLLDNKEYTEKSLDEDPMQMLMSILTFMRANEESKVKSIRVKEAVVRKRKDAVGGGKALSSRCPAWLKVEDSKYVVIEERSEVVQRIFKMYISGIGLDTIAKTLTKEDIPTFGKSTTWHRSTVLNILFKKYAMGIMESSSGHPDISIYPPIISPLIFQQAQDLRISNRRHKNSSKTKIPNMLRSVARCKTCGATMGRITNKSTGRGYLRCNASRRLDCTDAKAIPAPAIEDGILNNIHLLLSDIPEGGDEQAKIRGKMTKIEEQNSLLDDQIEALLNFLTSTNTKHASVSKKLEEMEKTKVALKGEHALLLNQLNSSDATVVSVKVDALANVMGMEANEMDASDRLKVNAVLRSCFESITIHKEEKMLRFKWSHANHETDLPYGM